MAETLEFELVSPERLLVSEPVEMVTVPGTEGVFGVLPLHAPTLSTLRPGIDGVILRDGAHQATFLPQVWINLPDVDCFLDHLGYKLGIAPGLWREKHLDVLVYQVEEFQE